MRAFYEGIFGAVSLFSSYIHPAEFYMVEPDNTIQFSYVESLADFHRVMLRGIILGTGAKAYAVSYHDCGYNSDITFI